MSTKDKTKQTSRGTHTREDAPRAMPYHLEASFKSNECESKNGDASSAHEREMAAHTSQISSLTLKSSSHPSPSFNLSRDWLLEGVGRSFGSLRVCLSRGEAAASEVGRRGIYRRAPKLAITVLVMYLSELPSLGRNSRRIKFS